MTIAAGGASVVVLVVGSASGLASARWSATQCQRSYKAWLRSHRAATQRQKLNHQSKLDSQHGCALGHPRLVALVGLGASKSTWRSRHRQVPGSERAFDPMPGVFTGSQGDEEFEVSFFKGKVAHYSQKLAPHTAQP